MQRTPALDRLSHSLKFGVRSLRRNLGFTAVAVFTLSLTIGANTAVFSVVDGLLLRPLPLPDSEKLVWITRLLPALDMQLVTGGDYLQWRRDSKVFEEIAALRPNESFNLTSPGEPARIAVARVSSNFLRALGVSPVEGRSFAGQEDRSGQGLVAIVSRRFFDQRFGSAVPLSSQQLILDDKSFEIVGILGRGFHVFGHPEVDVLIPLALDPAQENLGDQNTIVEVVGRLRPGLTLNQGRAELSTIQLRVGDANSATAIEVEGLKEHLVGRYHRTLIVLQCAVALVLLIGCVNLATLFLGQLSTREREFGIRSALGAGARWIAEQILTESWLLSLCGGAVGLLVGVFTIKLLEGLARTTTWASLAFYQNNGLNLHVFGATFMLMVFTGFFVGIFPVLVTWQSNCSEALRGTSQGGLRGIRQDRIRRYLIVCEMALALVLLNEAGLLIKSLYQLVEVDPGFRPQNVLTFSLQLSPTKYTQYTQRAALCTNVGEQLAALAGVEAVGLSDSLPLSGNASQLYALASEDSPQLRLRERQPVDLIYVSTDYFRAMGIRLIRGRSFARTDLKEAPFVMVSEGLAKHFWGSADVLGKRIRKGPSAVWSTIVGVVADVHQDALEKPKSLTIYQPLWASDLDGAINISIRSRVNPEILVRESRAVVRSFDREAPVYNIATMEERLSQSTSPKRFNALSLGLFAGLAIVLVAIGIYGLISFFVAKQMHDIGIRVALGASRKDILGLILTEGLWLLPISIAVGVPFALLLGKSLGTLLFEVKATDWGILFSTVGALVLTTLLACSIPARRGTSVDPMVILRHE